jgi:hypothetical protein
VAYSLDAGVDRMKLAEKIAVNPGEQVAGQLLGMAP